MTGNSSLNDNWDTKNKVNKVRVGSLSYATKVRIKRNKVKSRLSHRSVKFRITCRIVPARIRQLAEAEC